jgi:hypothetical protein
VKVCRHALVQRPAQALRRRVAGAQMRSDVTLCSDGLAVYACSNSTLTYKLDVEGASNCAKQRRSVHKCVGGKCGLATIYVPSCCKRPTITSAPTAITTFNMLTSASDVLLCRIAVLHSHTQPTSLFSAFVHCHIHTSQIMYIYKVIKAYNHHSLNMPAVSALHLHTSCHK